MSAPKNLQRDAIYVNPDGVRFDLSTVNAVSTLAINLNGPTAVAQDFNSAQSGVNLETLTALEKGCIGCYINQPIGDRVPYRIKASCSVPGFTHYNVKGLIVIGFAPASITGSDDVIAEPTYIPFFGGFDDLVIVEAQESGDTYFGRALAVGVGINTGITVTTLPITLNISVQNLGTRPPTMQNAIS